METVVSIAMVPKSDREAILPESFLFLFRVGQRWKHLDLEKGRVGAWLKAPEGCRVLTPIAGGCFSKLYQSARPTTTHLLPTRDISLHIPSLAQESGQDLAGCLW